MCILLQHKIFLKGVVRQFNPSHYIKDKLAHTVASDSALIALIYNQ